MLKINLFFTKLEAQDMIAIDQQQISKNVLMIIQNVTMDILQKVVMIIKEIHIRAVEVAVTIIREMLKSRQEATILRPAIV